MTIACNIDRRGIELRRNVGIVLALGAVALAIGAFLSPWTWLWWPAVGFCIGGAVLIFEASTGWCMLRAMGFKTRI